MPFHPRQPKRFAGITIQGIFPKRQQQFAEKLGKLVSEELLSFADIENKITHPDNIQKILPQVEQHIDQFLRIRLKETMPMISLFIGEKTINELKTVFMRELEELFPAIMKNYMANLQHELNLEKIVVEKVAAFSSDKLEAILVQIMSKEFRFIEIIGGVLGFIIGVIQVLITFLAGG